MREERPKTSSDAGVGFRKPRQDALVVGEEVLAAIGISALKFPADEEPGRADTSRDPGPSPPLVGEKLARAAAMRTAQKGAAKCALAELVRRPENQRVDVGGIGAVCAVQKWLRVKDKVGGRQGSEAS